MMHHPDCDVNDINPDGITKPCNCVECGASLAAPAGSAVGGDFYNGVEWLACWLLDNAEGETITEEQLRPWAAKAWEAHLKRQNDRTET